MRCKILIVLASLFANPVNADSEQRPDIIASNAFYYYSDVEQAWTFYRDTLGFETVVDYGFAKILRLSATSYLTLVRASEGMHSADEPKTVLLTLNSNDQSRWQALLEDTGIPVMDDVDRRSILFEDPGGYLIRIHEQVALGDADAVVADTGRANAATPSVHSTVYTVYVDDLNVVADFYNGLFDTRPVLQSADELLYAASSTGQFAIHAGSDGRLRPTEKSGVTLSFLTTDVDQWFARAKTWPGFELRTPEVLNEGGLVRVFVGYDPAGTFLEWDTFLERDENADLLRYLPR